jgi:membrane protease subunit HflC
MRTILILSVVALAVLALYSSIVFVDYSEFVYVTEFGKPIASYDGRTEAGWHWKLPWPIQSVQRLGRQLQVFDLPAVELLTHDAKGQTIDKRLAIEGYVCWRIPDKEGVGQFIVTVGTGQRARDVLTEEINSRLGAEISKRPADSLISQADTDTVRRRFDQLSQVLLNGLRPAARSTYGIELVDIRLRRFNYPASVRDAIFDRIRSERNRQAARYRSEGEQRAADIKSEADRQARDIRTEARAEEIRRRREADVRADDILNQAHSQDRDFYTFLQKLDAYRKMLGEARDVLLLSSKHEIFDMLLKPPRPNAPSEVLPRPSDSSPAKSGNEQ